MKTVIYKLIINESIILIDIYFFKWLLNSGSTPMFEHLQGKCPQCEEVCSKLI